MDFIDVVQTCYGRESLHCVPTAFLLRSYYVNYVTTTIVSRFCKGKGTFIPRCRRQHYVCYTFVRCLTRPLYVCSKFSFASMAHPAIKYNYFHRISHNFTCASLLSRTHRIRTFFCNVLCIKATKLCLRRRLPLCC